MALSIRADLHYCRLGADYVLLCLRTDRYLLLRGDSAECFERFLSGAASRTDLAWLTEHQLVSNASGNSFATCERIPPPTSSFHDIVIPPAPKIAVASVLVAQHLARRELAAQSLGAIIASLGRVEPGVREADSAASLKLAAAFQRARRYAPAIDRCLVRGLAMKRMLRRRNCEAALVIGVAMPFSAHCWIQAGDVVLSDRLDTVLPYSPILVA